MNNLNLLLSLLFAFLMISCNSENSELSVRTLKSLDLTPPATKPDEMVSQAEEAKSSLTINNNVAQTNKKIIKDGSISIRVKDIVSSKKAIDKIVKEFNSYYETEMVENYELNIFYHLKIRIPSDNFEKLVSAIESGEDEISRKKINSRDVTEEYIDIEARLNNKRDYLKRYRELLVKASTVKDIIEIEENIRKLQEEIESKAGRLKYLIDQISFSTLEIDLQEEKEYTYKPKPHGQFLERVKTSLNNGWHSFVDFILWTINIWWIIGLILVIVFIVRRRMIKRKSKI